MGVVAKEGKGNQRGDRDLLGSTESRSAPAVKSKNTKSGELTPVLGPRSTFHRLMESATANNQATSDKKVIQKQRDTIAALEEQLRSSEEMTKKKVAEERSRNMMQIERVESQARHDKAALERRVEFLETALEDAKATAKKLNVAVAEDNQALDTDFIDKDDSLEDANKAYSTPKRKARFRLEGSIWQGKDEVSIASLDKDQKKALRVVEKEKQQPRKTRNKSKAETGSLDCSAENPILFPE